MGVLSTEAELARYDLAPVLLGVFVSLVSWAAFYMLLVLVNSSKSPGWHCRVVSTFHATLVVFMTSWSAFVQGPWPFTAAGSENTKLHHWTCVVCLGYFLYDLVWSLVYASEDQMMLLHHVISIFGMCLVIFRGRNGPEMMATLWGSEMTNPCLHMRWFLRDLDRHKTWYAEVNDHVFMILFGIIRIGIGGVLLFTTLRNPKPDWIAKSGGVSFYAVSLAFWVMIVKYAMRKYKKIFAERKRQQQDAANKNGLLEKHTVNHSNGHKNDVAKSLKSD